MSLGAGQYLEWQGAEKAKFQDKEDHFQIVTNIPPPPCKNTPRTNSTPVSYLNFPRKFTQLSITMQPVASVLSIFIFVRFLR